MSEIQLHERSKDEIFNIAVQLRTDNFIKEKRIEELETQLQQKENIIKEAIEYITNYESISTIQELEDVEKNKDLDEKTFNEMVRRYMIVHDRILEILDKAGDEK